MTRNSLTRRFGTFLDVLMSRPNASVRLKPEEAITLEVADMLREFTLSGAYKGLWLHIPNEGKRGKVANLVLMMLGMIVGATDFVLAWNAEGGCKDIGFIEIKVPGKQLQPNQECFRDWVLAYGFRHAVCHSQEEVYLTLLDWGALRVMMVSP